jgi:hypothetical protein
MSSANLGHILLRMRLGTLRQLTTRGLASRNSLTSAPLSELDLDYLSRQSF